MDQAPTAKGQPPTATSQQPAAGSHARDVETRLADLLTRVIDWLKFAEAKNTAAVGLASTALGVIVTFLVAGPSVEPLAGAGMAIGAVVLMVSLMLAVASFLPSTDLEKHLLGEREKPSERDNLLFYGHIARYEPRALVIAIGEMYFDQPEDAPPPSKFAIDLAGQIVTNARITVRKLELFRYSLLLFGFGVLIASAAMALAAFLVV